MIDRVQLHRIDEPADGNVSGEVEDNSEGGRRVNDRRHRPWVGERTVESMDKGPVSVEDWRDRRISVAPARSRETSAERSTGEREGETQE